MNARIHTFQFIGCKNLKSSYLYRITNTQWTGFLFVLLHSLDDCGPPPIVLGWNILPLLTIISPDHPQPIEAAGYIDITQGQSLPQEEGSFPTILHIPPINLPQSISEPCPFCNGNFTVRARLVLGSPVSRLQKNRDRTGPRLPRTGNSQDRRRPQLRSSLRSLRILEISRPTKDRFNQSQPVFAAWKVTQLCTVVYKYLCNISTSAFTKSPEIVIGSGVWMWSTMSVTLSSLVLCSYPSHHLPLDSTDMPNLHQKVYSQF